MLNIFVGFEQFNRYNITDEQGNPVAYFLEERSFTKMIQRQILRTKRPFQIHMIDTNGKPILFFHRPLTFINSKVSVETPNGALVGYSQQSWHPFRRKYDLYEKEQFADIDSPMLAWEFIVRDENYNTIARVDRNFTNVAREVFTDAGQYSVTFDSRLRNPLQRSIVLACALSIDFDYFSRHSRIGFIPFSTDSS